MGKDTITREEVLKIYYIRPHEWQIEKAKMVGAWVEFGVYKRSIVLAYLDARGYQRRTSPTRTDWLTKEDIGPLYKLECKVYGVDDTSDPKLLSRFLEHNPYLCRFIFNAENREDIYGAIRLLPVGSKEWMNRLVEVGTVKAGLQPASGQLIKYGDSGSYDLYVASVIMNPNLPLSKKASHLNTLINSYLDWWLENPQRKLKTIWARTVTEEGVRMCQNFGLYPFVEEGVWKQSVFWLDTDIISSSRLVRKFQQKLKDLHKS